MHPELSEISAEIPPPSEAAMLLIEEKLVSVEANEGVNSVANMTMPNCSEDFDDEEFQKYLVETETDFADLTRRTFLKMASHK